MCVCVIFSTKMRLHFKNAKQEKATHGLSSLLDDAALDGLAETGVVRNCRSSAWHTKGRQGTSRRGGSREAGNSNKSKSHLRATLCG